MIRNSARIESLVFGVRRVKVAEETLEIAKGRNECMSETSVILTGRNKRSLELSLK